MNRFIPNSYVGGTDNSGIIVIVEKNRASRIQVNLLDRLADVIAKGKGFVYKKNGRTVKISKSDADRLAEMLITQAKKLEAMAASYRIMATALTISKENFSDVVKGDENLKKIIDNPFN